MQVQKYESHKYKSINYTYYKYVQLQLHNYSESTTYEHRPEIDSLFKILFLWILDPSQQKTN